MSKSQSGVGRSSARVRARAAIRDEVALEAFDLFVDHGYENTTIDDVCRAAGVSRSTFFRYFPSKEQVLVSRVLAFGEQMLLELESRPDQEKPWTALRRSLDGLLETYGADPERAMRVARLLTRTQVLAVRHEEKVTTWSDVLRPEVARRLGATGPDPLDPRPNALIAATLGYLDAAIGAWANGDGSEPLSRILDRAMDAIGR